MKGFALLTVCLLTCSLSFGQTTSKKETPHLEFVKEFIRELSAVEEIRERGEQEQKQDPEAAVRNIIHSGTLFKLEIGSEIRMLETMHLKDPFDTVVPNLISFQKKKIVVWERMIELGRTFAEAPKPGVDYAKLGAEMPELRARLEFIDESIFKMTPLVFGTLIDMKPDSQGNASHLIITKAERAELLDELHTDFGDKMDKKGDQTYFVSAATVLRAYLQKDFKSADESWN